MELTELTVDTHSSILVPWEETLLMPVGDVQYGAQGVNLPKLKRHVEWGVANNSYFTGLGDYIDVASPSGRSKFNKAEFYDSVGDSIDAHVHKLLDDLKRTLEVTQGRWLMLNKGHHWWQFSEEYARRHGLESDTDKELAKFLGCPVTADMGLGLGQLTFRDMTGKKNRSIRATVWQHHGEGSGQTMAAPLNKLEKTMSRWPTVDIFLIGHYSRKVGYPVDALEPKFGKHPTVVARRRILACTGGFMTGYEVGGRASYVEKSMMSPTNLGGVVIYIRPVHEANHDRLDMNISV